MKGHPEKEWKDNTFQQYSSSPKYLTLSMSGICGLRFQFSFPPWCVVTTASVGLPQVQSPLLVTLQMTLQTCAVHTGSSRVTFCTDHSKWKEEAAIRRVSVGSG